MTERERELYSILQKDPMISQRELAKRLHLTRPAVAAHISHLMEKGYIAGRGYLLRSPRYVAVVGGANLDIGGRSHAPLVYTDSNPGQVRMSLGGVGRNIAHNLALLDCKVRLLTALGEDGFAEQIVSSCREIGIDLSDTLRVPEGTTSVYVFLAGDNGDMALAVNDMEIYRHLTPTFLAGRERILCHAGALVVDTNIPAESIQWLCDHIEKVPIFADPVSTAKAEKLKPVLGKLHTLKPNRIEAEILSGIRIVDDESLERAAQTLLDTGLRQVFISLGEEGVYAACGDRAVKLPGIPAETRSATGAGDAFMAALVWGFLEGAGLIQTAKLAQAAAVITVEGEETVNPALSASAVRQRAGL